jgi:hypothetical protein
MKRRFTLLWLVWLVTAAGPAHVEGAETRIAILGKDSALMTVADGLTVKFSRAANLAVLERAQVQKVWQEQALNAGQSGSYRKLGEVLGADGVLLLETIKEGADSYLIVRLLAVRSGVVVDFSRHKFPLADEAGWSDLLVRRELALLPKLSMSREQAVPISFLNVRSSLALPGAAVIEQQLNILLDHRLMSQREFILLERRQLGALAAEKELQQVEDTAFWTGSHILDGIIDKDGIVPGKVTLSMTLQPPNNRPKVQFEVSGDKQDLPGLVELMMAKLLPAITGKAAAGSWNADEEAGQYADEALWAMKWKLPQEALMAAETAWILGRKNEAMAQIRVNMLRGAAGTQKEMTGLNGRDWVVNAPEPGKLEKARDLLLLYEDCSRHLRQPTGAVSSIWLGKGNEVISTAAEVLEHYRELPSAQNGQEEAVSELKAECRRVVAMLGTMIPKTDLAQQAKFDLTKLRYCSYWVSSPEEAAQIYRELVRAETFSINRETVLRDANFRMRYWGWEDRTKVQTLWAGFLHELKDTTNLVQQCDSLLFSVRDQPKSKNRETQFWVGEEIEHFQEAVRAVLALIWNDKNGFKEPVTPGQINVLEGLISDHCHQFMHPWAIAMMQAQKDRAFEKFFHYVKGLPVLPREEIFPGRFFDPPAREYGPRNFEWTEERARKVIPYLEHVNVAGVSVRDLEKLVHYSASELGDYLRRTQTYDGASFQNFFYTREYTRAEADALRPLLEEFVQRFPRAEYSVKNLIIRKLQTPTSITQAKSQAMTEYMAKLAQLRQVLKTSTQYDQAVFQTLATDYFTETDAKELLPLWQSYVVRTKAEKPLRTAEEHLLARSVPIEEVKKYFETATTYDAALVSRQLVARFLTKDEAVILRPVYEAYARRLNLEEKQVEFHTLQLNRARGNSLPHE